MSIGKNTPSGERLLSFITRVETIRERKQEVANEEKQVFAEAVAEGYDAKSIRTLIRRRAMDKAKREEADALLDVYAHAIGMEEAPLFRSAGLMGVDRTAREAVIKALREVVPDEGDIIIRAYGVPVRLYRDADGQVQAEDWQEPKPPSSANGPSPNGSTPNPMPPKQVPPEFENVSDDDAEAIGEAAAKDGANVIDNPFPAGDRRRARWDKGWRRGHGSDGMGPAWRRFELQIGLELPGQEERERILALYLAPYRLAGADAPVLRGAEAATGNRPEGRLGDMARDAVIGRLLAAVAPHPDLPKPPLWVAGVKCGGVGQLPWPLERA